MVDQDYRVRENRVRRWAKRLGWEVQKSRVRLTHLDDHGGYRLENMYYGFLEGEKFDLDLDDVERILEEVEEGLKERRTEGS